MKLFIASLLAILPLIACSSDSEMQMEGPAVTSDPVSHAEVHTDSPWKTQWHGDWYFFESEENLKKFQARPEAYVTSEGTPKRERRTIYPHDLQ